MAKTNHDQQFIRLLDQISSIYEKSSEVASREIGKRFEFIVDFYNKQQCENTAQFLTAFDNSNLPEDFLLFKLVYFNHLLLNRKGGGYFGYEDFNIVFASDYDRIMDQNDPADKLQHTGWRGSGKSTDQMINTIRAMYYGTRDSIGFMGRKIGKAKLLLRNALTQFVSREVVEGQVVPTLFAQRAMNLVLFSRALAQKDKKNMERAFKSMSLDNGFSLENGVTIVPYSPESGGRGANFYGARLNMLHVDDSEDYGEAGTVTGENIWNQITTFMNADTGNPDDRIILTISGNRVNPEPESIFNRFIEMSGKDPSFIVRSVPKVDLVKNKSLTIRYTYEEIMQQIRSTDRPAEITDCPLHTKEILFPILEMDFRPLEELREIPTWRGLFVDPAFSRTNFSDKTGLIYVYVTKDRKIYFGSKEVKVTGEEIVGAIVKELADHKMNYCFVESGTSESLLRSSVENEIVRMNINTVSFGSEAPRKQGKEDRIKDSFQFWDGRTMGFIEGMEEPLISQLISFDPYLLKTKKKSRGFDALDAFSWAITYITKMNLATSFDIPKGRPDFAEDTFEDDGVSIAPTY